MMIAHMAETSGQHIEGEFATSDELRKITPLLFMHQANAPMVFINNVDMHYTWAQYFDYHKKEIDKEITRLLDKMKFLDSRLIALLAEIEDAEFFKRNLYYVSGYRSNSYLFLWHNEICQFFDLIKELDQHFKVGD